jgi:lipoprotein-releasing system permease protein
VSGGSRRRPDAGAAAAAECSPAFFSPVVEQEGIPGSFRSGTARASAEHLATALAPATFQGVNLPVEFALALRYLRPRRTFVSIITLLSWGGVAIAVMVLIVVLSVMTGFRQEFEKKIIGFNAPVTVTSANIIYDADKIVALIEKQPGVTGAAGVVRGPVLVEIDNRMAPAYISSAPLDGDDPVLPLKKFLIAGDYELRGDSVLIGRNWGANNGVFPGDKITIFGGGAAQNFLDQQKARAAGDNTPVVHIMPDEPVVRGVFQTGHYAFDNDFLLVSMEMAQHIYGLEDGGVQEIAVRVKDLDQVNAVRDEINAILPRPLFAATWMDNNHDFLTALATERVVMTFILFMVMIVAAFGLCSTLITITVQKSREIGLMKALGANDLQVCSVFLLHSAVVGVVGSISGTILGLLVLHYRNPFRDFLLHRFGIQVFNPDVYGQTTIPAVINPVFVTIVALSAVAICLLASLLPAANAARLAPARALRYE